MRLLERLFLRLARKFRHRSMRLVQKAVKYSVLARNEKDGTLITLDYDRAPAESMWIEDGDLTFKNAKTRFSWADWINIYRYINHMA